MIQTLRLHPASSCAAVRRIEVAVMRTGPRRLSLRYQVAGNMQAVRIPPPVAPGRGDGLWRSTCFEAFVRPPQGEAYWELNLSPSGRWAAYGFARYRDGGYDVDAPPAPCAHVQHDAGRLLLDAEVDLSGIAGLPADLPWSVGLSAVIEEVDGTVSYWALAHPPGKADFHHPDCFALQLVAPERS